MRKNYFLCFLFLLLIACKSDDEFTESLNSTIPSELSIDKEKGFLRFSEILSKAVYEKKEIREFLKSQALEKIDNGYNIFYPVSKDKKVDETNTFRDILIDYAENKDELESIEKALPLLNIHTPEILSQKVIDMDVDDEETPILYMNKLYLNGAIVDTLGVEEIPDFNIFVVGESESIQKKHNLSTRASSGMDLNAEFEYVDKVFSPINNNSKQNLLKTSGHEGLSPKYDPKGQVPRKDVDPVLLKAFENSRNNLRATRSMVYYRMSTPNQIPGSLRTDVKDCLFRFKVAGNAFERLESIATDNGKDPLFHGNTSNKKTGLSRQQVLDRLLRGRKFCFMFRIEGDINGQSVVSEGMKVYASPEQLFNLSIGKRRRHPTAFRRTKYTYWIEKHNVKEKWFYPMDHGHDTRLNRWDIAHQPINKKIVAYLVDPNDGISKNITETYNVTYVTKNELGANISGKIKEIVTIGINGKISKETTITKGVTTTYTVNHKNEKLDEFYFNFFDDYPIQNTKGHDLVIPAKIGKGIIETCILPVTNSFYNEK